MDTLNESEVTTSIETVLVLRTCSKNMTSYEGFVWPTSGPVEELPGRWNPEPVCGYGLHGFLWGEGDGSLASWDESAKWLVVSVAKADIVNLDGKVKFPRGEVVFCGDRLGATKYIIENGAQGRSVLGSTVHAGARGTATAGARGTATAGDGGTATAGYGGTATAGDSGELRLRYYDPKNERYRTVVAFVGEDGIEPNTAYVLDESHEFVLKCPECGRPTKSARKAAAECVCGVAGLA